VISVAVCTGAVTLMMEFAGSQDCVRSNADRVEKRRVVNVTTGGGVQTAAGGAGEEGARGGRKDCGEEMDHMIVRGKEGSCGGRSAGCVIDNAERKERARKEGSQGGEGSHDGHGGVIRGQFYIRNPFLFFIFFCTLPPLCFLFFIFFCTLPPLCLYIISFFYICI
jgi:hypothetical protein